MSFQKYITASMAVVFFCIPVTVLAANGRSPEIKVFSTETRTTEINFIAYDKKFLGGASVAVCDLDGNGYEEIITGAGVGGGPQIRIFDSLGRPKFTPGFFAYDQNFKGGVNVACGDLDNDGNGEIITAPKINGGPHVRIFNRYGESIFTPGFFAFDPGFKGGVNIAVGDIDGGGLQEIIVAPASDAEPRVRVFDIYGSVLNYNIYPFHAEYSGGVSLTTANVDGGLDDELVVAVQSQDAARVKVLKPSKNILLGEWTAFPESFKGGINIASADIDNDGFDEIIAAANSGGGPHIRAFEYTGLDTGLSIFAYENDFRGGVNVSAGDVDSDGVDEIVASPQKKFSQGVVTSILVDLSEQRLFAYENSFLLKTFLVSTGIPGMDTQPGDFKVSQKIYSKLYSGPGYYLPNTLWNMRFDGSRLLHGAYWHNNFGHRMSHGCVNIEYSNAEWLYNATPIGTRVVVQQ